MQTISPARQAEAAIDDKTKWHVLVASFLGEMCDGMDASIYVLVLYPALCELLHTTSHGTVAVIGSVVLFCFLCGWAIGAVAFGIFADYFGRARAMIWTILVYAICTALCALAHNWWQLAFLRFLVGAGIGGEISIGGVIVSEYWKGKARLHAVATLCSAFAVGYFISAVLNWVLGPYGWRWLYVAGIAPALVAFYIRAKLREPEQFVRVQELKHNIRIKPRELRSDSETKLIRFTFPELFSNENLGKLMVVGALASTSIIGYWAVLAWIPAWINQITGTQAIAERSQAAMVMNIGAVIASLLGGYMMNWFGKANAFRLTFVGAFISCVGMFMTVKAFGLALLTWVFFVGAFGTLPFVFIFTYVPELFRANLRGTAFGFTVQSGRIFAGFAALAAGQIIQAFGGSYAAAGSSVAMIYLFGIAATFFMPSTNGEVELGIETF